MTATKKLYLDFHGRIIDSLGIQMYQSPVAALAELIANSWDADATKVEITLPGQLDDQAEIAIADDGIGMSFDDCQTHYLKVGRNRRVAEGKSTTPGGRPCLGRKGLGKFAGFGIAVIMEVSTTSKENGERTVFQLDLNNLRSDDFVSTDRKEIKILEMSGPDASRRAEHGTVIRLRALKLAHRRTPEALGQQMARRFSLAEQAANFRVSINGKPLPKDTELTSIQFSFPTDYRAEELPAGLVVTSDGWGIETLNDRNRIKWRVRFTHEPISIEEFRGISVFCGIKLAQTPFTFQLTGGLSGQHGEQYMTGLVQADYLDQGAQDVITTERQRINWEDATAVPLLHWGQARVKSLYSLWKSRRNEKRLREIDERIADFTPRLERLRPHEAKTVKKALTRIAGIEAIDDGQFSDLAGAILTAWEAGRLREIIEDVARMEDMDANVLMSLLVEHRVLSALHIAEVVKLKVDVIDGLRRRIEGRELETAVRDYISKEPWLISPRWETFKVEVRISNLAKEAAQESGIANDDDWKGRVDLVLSSGHELLVLEFMRPGLPIDRNHIDRFQRYVDILRSKVEGNTSLQFRSVTGLLVADKLAKKPEDIALIKRMADAGMHCQEWSVLLAEASVQWGDFLKAIAERAPSDARIQALGIESSPSDAATNN